jgi:hypothetical protein
VRGGGLVERVLGADADLERTAPGEPGKGPQSRAVRPDQDAVHGEILVDGQVKVPASAAMLAARPRLRISGRPRGMTSPPARSSSTSTLPTASAICATGSPLVWSIVTSAPISRR